MKLRLTFKSEFVPVLAILLSFAAGFYFNQHFPAIVATHFNTAGQANRWSSRAFAAFFLPVVELGIYLLLLVIPYLDPKGERYQEFSNTYHTFKAAIILLLAAIYFVFGFVDLGYNLDAARIILALMGAMFVVFGVYMPKIKMNWTMGIRTPWTLSNEQVWNATHRFGGKVFTAAGLILVITSFFPTTRLAPALIVIIAVAALLPAVYSYFLYRRIKG